MVRGYEHPLYMPFDFWEPLAALRAGTMTREAAVAEMSRKYREFVAIFEAARTR